MKPGKKKLRTTDLRKGVSKKYQCQFCTKQYDRRSLHFKGNKECEKKFVEMAEREYAKDKDNHRWVKCAICGWTDSPHIVVHVKNVHGLTREEYEKEYPNSKIVAAITKDIGKGMNKIYVELKAVKKHIDLTDKKKVKNNNNFIEKIRGNRKPNKHFTLNKGFVR
jgi:hypothetical protein